MTKVGSNRRRRRLKKRMAMALPLSLPLPPRISKVIEVNKNVEIPIPDSSTRAIEDNRSDTQISQESSNNISNDEWLISVKNYDDKTVKPQIQRIPSLLREKQSNKKCYDPLVVSIGPYHHGKQLDSHHEKQLDAFEKLKIPIAQKFWHACENKVSIEQIYEAVAREGNSARECYEEGPTDESFNKMMFLDACFVLHFMSVFETESNYSNGTDMKNPLGPLLPWSSYLTFVCRDLFLLENQIPSQVLKVLMKFRFKNESEGTMLIQNFLDKMTTIMPPQERTHTNAVKKVVQRMMGCSVQKKEERKINMDECHHLLHLVREQLIGSSPEDKNEKKSVKCLLYLDQLVGSSPEYKKEKKWYSYHSVTELKSAGIHFRPSQTNHVTDVKFKSHLFSGTLTLPRIMVDDTTKPLLLNLAAYEMCPGGPSDFRIMSYICLMNSLIDHADDVKELRRKRILVNNLGSDDELAQLFNEISNGLVFDPKEYEDLMLQIQKHCESKAKVWMAECIHDHFSSPWAFLAFLGAIFVIFLTAVQTYFAVFSH
ncbi:unnamed protein product [Fraxinus pennsylvanica]|uniref:Uncharacterized protein n=1 Tax=Fraxinus pennsylvanica TaxID=56036 RepID=A0AAD2A1A6_9LAMI|nr:unnamed protein product [Fraxinus pennsylvanica]